MQGDATLANEGVNLTFVWNANCEICHLYNLRVPFSERNKWNEIQSHFIFVKNVLLINWYHNKWFVCVYKMCGILCDISAVWLWAVEQTAGILYPYTKEKCKTINWQYSALILYACITGDKMQGTFCFVTTLLHLIQSWVAWPRS